MVVLHFQGRLKFNCIASISLTLVRMWLRLQACLCAHVCVCKTLYQHGSNYFWEPCLLHIFKPTGNGKMVCNSWNRLRLNGLKMYFFFLGGTGSRCDCSSCFRSADGGSLGSRQGTVNHCRLISCYVFSAGMGGGGELLYHFPFHTSVRGQSQHSHRQTFVMWKHSTSGMGLYSQGTGSEEPHWCKYKDD